MLQIAFEKIKMNSWWIYCSYEFIVVKKLNHSHCYKKLIKSLKRVFVILSWQYHLDF